MAKATNTQFAVAVHVLTYLAATAAAGRTSPVSSEELAGSTSVSPVHIRKVLGPLRAAGFAHSRAGAHGGWELAHSPDEINLAQVWRALQGDEVVLGIHGPNPACLVGANIQQVLVGVDQRVAAAITAELSNITLTDVLDEAGFDAADYALIASMLRA